MPAFCNLDQKEELDIQCEDVELSSTQEDLVAKELTYTGCKTIPESCFPALFGKHLVSKAQGRKQAPGTCHQSHHCSVQCVNNCALSTTVKNGNLRTQQRARIIEK